MTDDNPTPPTWRGWSVPRAVDEFEPTDHFMQRLKYRTDPAPTKEIVAETIAHGKVLHTHIADRRIYEYDSGLYTWRVLVALDEAAFDAEDCYHTLLTVYVPGRHGDDHETVFERGGRRD